jgi:DNA-binding transcriptional MerR regulator
VAPVTAKDILMVVIIPLALAEFGPWCGWLAVRVMPLAAKLRYGDTERAAVRLEEWFGDLDDIPGQLTKLAYAFSQFAAGSAVSARRKTARAKAHSPQGALFEAEEAPRIPLELLNVQGDIGYRGPTACAAAGITYRTLDYWARVGLVEPSVRNAHGSGSRRLYSFRDIVVLKVMKRLIETGISLQRIQAAVQHLRDRGIDDLVQVTLMSDGVSVYECTSADEVVDLLQGGQGVYGIALGRVWREVAGDLAVLPAVRAEDGFVAVDPNGSRGSGAAGQAVLGRSAPASELDDDAGELDEDQDEDHG